MPSRVDWGRVSSARAEKEEGRGWETHDFTEQHDILSSDQEDSALGLGVRVCRRVVEPFEGLSRYEVGC